jgi:hypothetical protein
MLRGFVVFSDAFPAAGAAAAAETTLRSDAEAQSV